MGTSRPEVWLRGPVAGVPAPLQPVAHALLQAQEEVRALVDGFPESLLWTRPGGVASVGFHLQHIPGVLDRLFTYARGDQLTAAQLDALRREATARADVSVADLLQAFDEAVTTAIAQLRATAEASLTEGREVGRGRLPSTVLGLLVHAAEHTQRHVGQLLVTARVQRVAASTDS
jgi:uncharacterized damage-inducible protein DinB